MTKKIFTTILFFGALWGLLEATLGYVLQFLPPLVSGSIMFPIGATVLLFAYTKTGTKWSAIYVGLIAATIKSVNFFMPGLLFIKTYNPMIAIMLQSLVMVAVFYALDRKKLPATIASLTLASMAWRALFLANISINHALTGFIFPQLANSSKMVEFVIYYGLMGALFASVLCFGFILIKKHSRIDFKPNLAVSLTLMMLAMTLTYYIQSLS
ncbi:MAG: hypothetical protein IH571_00660 [Acholeplasmataceae bacterium]|nr:hypothetical protein [Acholeplasmataceae bacterium]